MQIQINHENREIKEHGTFSFPVMVSYEVLSSYDRGSFFWHWHPEVELTIILSGDILYQVNDKTFHLKAGDGLFCNCNMPHTGKMASSADCVYISVTFDPKIIYGFESSLLQTKYVTPLTISSGLSSILLNADCPWQRDIIDHIKNIWTLNQNLNEMYAFQLQLLLSQIWFILYENANPSMLAFPSIIRDRERILTILSYLHQHYSEKIKLENVAAEISICTSECCRFFKKNMKESIFEYLIRYRIERSLFLLENTKDSITEISSSVGFSNPCYFTKLFRAEIGCSPSEYRKNRRKT